MHVVHYNKRYDNFTHAVDKDDGLAVLGFFFEVLYVCNNSKIFFLLWQKQPSKMIAFSWCNFSTFAATSRIETNVDLVYQRVTVIKLTKEVLVADSDLLVCNVVCLIPNYLSL